MKLERWKTEDMRQSNLQVRTTLEKSGFLRALLKVVGVLAVSMVMSGQFALMVTYCGISLVLTASTVSRMTAKSTDLTNST